MNKLAQIDLGPGSGEGYTGFGILGLVGKKSSQASFIFADIITSIVGIISVVAIIWFVIIIITGSLSIMTAGGDKNALESAKKKISNGLIGLVGVIIGIFIVQLIGMLFGINLLNIPDLIYRSEIK